MPTPHKFRVLIDRDSEPETSGGLVGDDLLVGVPAISEFLYGKRDAATRRLVYGELNSGYWPAWRREFRGEVQRAQEKRIWTSFPSSAWMACNGVLKPRHLRGVRLAVRTISWIS